MILEYKYFTFLIVNIKPGIYRINPCPRCGFTFLIVNIKLKLNNAAIDNIINFTFLIVNIKPNFYFYSNPLFKPCLIYKL